MASGTAMAHFQTLRALLLYPPTLATQQTLGLGTKVKAELNIRTDANAQLHALTGLPKHFTQPTKPSDEIRGARARVWRECVSSHCATATEGRERPERGGEISSSAVVFRVVGVAFEKM